MSATSEELRAGAIERARSTLPPDDLDMAEMDAHWFYQDAVRLSRLSDSLFRIARVDALAAARLIFERESKMGIT